MKKHKFLRESIINAFILIKPNIFRLELAKQANITYSHLCRVMDDCKRENLIKFEKIGRRKIIILTEKGKRFQDKLISLMEDIKCLK